MRRFTTFLLFAYLFTLSALARELSADQALQRAFASMSKTSSGSRGIGSPSYVLAHTKKSASNGTTLYYVFSNSQTGGFMITSADTRANAVLGQTDNGSFEQALNVPGFRAWLNSCQEALLQLSNTEEARLGSSSPGVDIPEQVVTSADGNESLIIPGRCNTPDATLPASVRPLLGSIAWNQSTPYNSLCPALNDKGDLCVTGCVATAMAQVMKYHEWPKQGTGSFSYTPEGTDYTLSADFSKSIYDWGNMLEDYRNGYTDVQALAVAELMKDVGISVKMEYGAQSGAYQHDILTALTTYFGYNKGMLMCNRTNYNHTEWNNLLKKELAANRPLIYGGDNSFENAAHEFVIDGYNEEGNYHVNWGWGGSSNGYFDINFLDPANQGIGGSNGGYSYYQQTFLNCFPDQDGTSTPQYQLTIMNEPDLRDGMISCRISNLGLSNYIGQLGYIVVVDNKIVKTCNLLNITESSNFGFEHYITINASLDMIDVTPEMLAGKKCHVYPFYSDTDGNKVPLGMSAFASYVTLYADQEGKIVREFDEADNANLKCDRFEITRDYVGYNINARALITNAMNSVTFDRQITMFITDENNKTVAQGSNFAFIDAGESSELDFSCNVIEGMEIEAGKAYNAQLCFYSHFGYHTIPGATTTVTLKETGGAPNISYTNFAIDKTVIAPNEEITVSFDIENAGGFGIGDFYIYLYKSSGGYSLCSYELKDLNIPSGKMTVTQQCLLDLNEGKYFFVVYTKDNGFNQISDRLSFQISKDPGNPPSLSYSNFALDKTVIAPNEEITVSFDIENTGGYSMEDYGIFIYKNDESGQYQTGYMISDVELPKGKKTVTKSCLINLDEGSYLLAVFMLDNEVWQQISDVLYFDIKDEDTAISSITGDTVGSNQCYDLQGRRVTLPAKGLYIKNGKKFVQLKNYY